MARYWVGGTGNWSDTTHWAASTGAAGGETVPDTTQDVFFDANSFSAGGQSVTLDTDPSCKSMAWTGATNTPTWACGTNQRLTIAGSMTLIAGMTITGALNPSLGITWNSAASNTITLAGHTLPVTNENPVSTIGMLFNGGGTWTLVGSFIQPSTHISWRDATFDADGNAVEIRVATTSQAVDVEAPNLDFAGSTLTIHDFLLISNSRGTLTTATCALVTNPDLDYVGVSLRAGGQTFASWRAYPQIGPGSWGFAVTQGAITVTGNLTLEATGSGDDAHYDTSASNGTVTIGGLVSGGSSGHLIELTGTMATTGALSADYLSLDTATLTGVIPGIAGANSVFGNYVSGWKPLGAVEPSATLMGVG